MTRWVLLAAGACSHRGVLSSRRRWTVGSRPYGLLRLPWRSGALRFIEDDPNGGTPSAMAVDPNVLGGMMILVAALLGRNWSQMQAHFPRWLTFLMLAAAGWRSTYSRSALFGVWRRRWRWAVPPASR